MPELFAIGMVNGSVTPSLKSGCSPSLYLLKPLPGRVEFSASQAVQVGAEMQAGIETRHPQQHALFLGSGRNVPETANL